MSTCQGLFLAVRKHTYQDLSEYMKANFIQSEEAFYEARFALTSTLTSSDRTACAGWQ